MSRILVVDDSPTILHVMSKMLSKGGHEVVTSADGQEAVRVAVEEPPDLVLLDVILPKMTGYQVCRRLKSTPQTEHIPIVMLTSKTRDKDKQWGLKQGADEYVTKPVEEHALLDAIGRLLTQTDERAQG